MAAQDRETISVFVSYSHRDEELRDALDAHLALLKREGALCTWHDHRITAGREWEGEIDERLEAADLILLLVSSDFMASDYCFDREMKRAMERHEAGEARVIPIILRPVDLHRAPFSRLKALPTDGSAVTKWDNNDEALRDVTLGIRHAIEELRDRKDLACPTENPFRGGTTDQGKIRDAVPEPDAEPEDAPPEHGQAVDFSLKPVVLDRYGSFIERLPVRSGLELVAVHYGQSGSRSQLVPKHWNTDQHLPRAYDEGELKWKLRTKELAETVEPVAVPGIIDLTVMRSESNTTVYAYAAVDEFYFLSKAEPSAQLLVNLQSCCIGRPGIMELVSFDRMGKPIPGLADSPLADGNRPPYSRPDV